MRVGENNRKDGQSTTIFSITERKTRAQISITSMSHKENRGACKWLWKITSGVFIAFFFFLRIALKRPYNKYRSVNKSRPQSEISL